MSLPARKPTPAPLDPALLRIVEAMARAQAERDFNQARSGHSPLPEPTR